MPAIVLSFTRWVRGSNSFLAETDVAAAMRYVRAELPYDYMVHANKYDLSNARL